MIRGFNQKFPLNAEFLIPLYTRFELRPNSVVYLGRVEAVVRERKDDSEWRAGPVAPIIGQTEAGFSTGIFDIRVSDNYDEDLVVFRQKYPAGARFTVERAVLPPWTKPAESPFGAIGPRLK